MNHFRSVVIRRDPIAAAQRLPSWLVQCRAPSGAGVSMMFHTNDEAREAAPGLLAALRAPVPDAPAQTGWL